MKVRSTNYSSWIFIFEIVTAVHGIFTEEGTTVQDLFSLCNENGIAKSGWPENSKHKNPMNELMIRLDNDEDMNSMRYQNHKFETLYEQNTGIFQFPFGRIWKDKLCQLARNEVDSSKGESLQSKAPTYSNNKRGTNSFSSWGGKRDRIIREDALNNKREPAFSSWGGKRTQKFFNWGGKRSVTGNEVVDITPDNYLEHNIMRRDVDARHQNQSQKQRVCITNEMKLEELFKEFIDWSRKQPEQKKDSRRVFGVNALRSPDNLSRRTGSFYQWGGKRSMKNH